MNSSSQRRTVRSTWGREQRPGLVVGDPHRAEAIGFVQRPRFVGGHVPATTGVRVNDARQAAVRPVVVLRQSAVRRTRQKIPKTSAAWCRPLANGPASQLEGGQLGLAVHVGSDVAGQFPWRPESTGSGGRAQSRPAPGCCRAVFFISMPRRPIRPTASSRIMWFT